MLELFEQNVTDVNFIEMFIRYLLMQLLLQISLDYFITARLVSACMDLLLTDFYIHLHF